MAHITIRYFAAAAEAAGTGEELWQADSTATLADLRRHLAGRHGHDLQRVLAVSSFLIDGTVRRDDGPVNGQVVDVLPPFAGG